MIDLPRHLSRWGPQLALFPTELALALGPLVCRLASLVGGFRVAEANEGEPDGYDGIARRGTYDRLLPAEWLLLDEVPEEFVRRMVAGEHAFLRSARRATVGERRCLALFDAGLDQLGAPRLAHLALLVLLARRADEQRATLEWGVLQDPERSLQAGLTRSSVLHLLRTGRGRTLSATDLDRWAEIALGAERSETWLVGAESLARQASRLRASVILVSDVIEPSPPQRILVRTSELRPARAHAGTELAFIKEATLEVPSDALAVQLLRDPFATRGASRQLTTLRVDVRSNLVFAPDGRRVYIRGGPSTLVTLQVPNSPHATPGPTTAFSAPHGHTILAAGRSFSKSRTVVVSQLGQELFVHVLSKSGSSAVGSARFTPTHGYRLPPPSAARLFPLGVLDPHRFYLLDSQDRVVELCDGAILQKEDRPSIASQALRDYFAWVTTNAGVPQLSWVQSTDKAAPEIHRSWMPEPIRIHDPHGVRFGVGLSLAYSASPRGWVIVNQRRCSRVSVPEQLTVCGLIKLRLGRPELGLVALDAGHTRLHVLESGELKTLVTTGAPITSVDVSGTGSEVAYLTEAGELGVYSCMARAVVTRLKAEPFGE